MKAEEERLQRWFKRLRQEDRLRMPSYREVEGAVEASRGDFATSRWHGMVAAAACVVMGGMILMVLLREGNPRENSINFDALSRMLSTHFEEPSIGRWNAPSDVLLSYKISDNIESYSHLKP